MEQPGFASEFPAATAEQWRALADAVLKGGDFEKRLVSRSRDGIRIEPLYAKAPPQAGLARPGHAPWRVGQRVDHPDPAVANELAAVDLLGGADSLTLVFEGARSARGFGLPVGDADALETALRGVMLDLIHLRLEPGPDGASAAAAVLDLAERRGHRLAEIDIDLGLDPLGLAARTGASADASPAIADAVASLHRRGFVGRSLLADGRPYHEAGGSEGQELAAVLATAVAYLRALEAGGIALDRARDGLAFLLVADADQFLTIAKIRALRRLWGEIERGCGLDSKPIRIHAETAWRMLSRRDPWVNVLRGTLAAFSAGIGGADSVAVLPFTAALGLADAFARRLARNTQTILIEESNLWRIADPVAGSGGFEALTDDLSATGWRLFQEIEREGGLAASLSSGAIRSRIAAVRIERDQAIATRREAITGTSEYADLREAPVSVMMPFPAVAPGSAAPPRDAEAGLPSIRLSEPFEALRDRSDAILAATGARPKVFLANLGSVAAFSARATFARNFFEAGGIEAVGNDGPASLEALVAAFLDAGTPIACLCSSDAVYAAEAVPAAGALKTAGALRLYVAGRPGDLAEPLRVAGVSEHINVGSNLLTTLAGAYEIMEAAPHPTKS